MLRKIIICAFVLLISMSYAQSETPKFGEVTMNELQEKFHSSDSLAHAAYLYKEIIINYEYDSKTSEWYQVKNIFERIKIYDKKGIENATKEIPYYHSLVGKNKVSGIKASTYTLENGTIAKHKLKNKEVYIEDVNEKWRVKKFTMPSVKNGSIVEWSYTIKSPFSTYVNKMILQHDIPVNKFSAIMVSPDALVFRLVKTGSFPVDIHSGSRPMVGFNGNENIYIVKANNIPSFKEEAYISSKNNFILSIDFDYSYIKQQDKSDKISANSTWEEVSKKIFDYYYFGTNLDKGNAFKEDLKELKLEGKTPREQIAIALNLVKSKIKWNHKYGISSELGTNKAYKTGEGNVVDVNLALIVVLRELGFKANPILVSTRAHGIPVFPTMKGFNYVIAGVEGVDKDPILLDATEKYTFLNVLPFRVLNWDGRLVREDLTTQKVNLNPINYSQRFEQMNLSITTDLKIQAVLKTSLTNQRALRYRDKNNNLSNEAHKNLIEENYKVEIQNLKEIAKNDIGQPYLRMIQFTKDNGLDAINDKIYLNPFLFLKTQKNPFKLKNREYPVDFGYPWKNEYVIVFQVPAGYKVDDVPKGGSFAMSNNLGMFSYDIIQGEGFVKLHFVNQFNTNIIPPDFYNELKELYNRLILKQSERIILSKVE